MYYSFSFTNIINTLWRDLRSQALRYDLVHEHTDQSSEDNY